MGIVRVYAAIRTYLSTYTASTLSREHGGGKNTCRTKVSICLSLIWSLGRRLLLLLLPLLLLLLN